MKAGHLIAIYTFLGKDIHNNSDNVGLIRPSAC